MKTFTGTWQSKTDPLGRSNLVVNLKSDGGSLTGTVKYLNSEHLETVATVGFVFLENNALTFQTDDGASWRLVPKQRPNFATLWKGTNKLPIEKTIKSK